MEKWKEVRLGDCIKEIVEKTIQNNQYQVLSVTKDGIFSQEEFFKKQIASENNIGYKIIRKNNLVFSTMNLWMGSLDVLTKYDIGIVSPAYKVFEFNTQLMLPEYGDFYMKSPYMLEQYKNCSEQGASIVRRNLDLKALLNISIKVPTIREQEKIVKILKNVDEIIERYGCLLREKKQIIKSQFIEIFGNPVINEKGWELKMCKEITSKIGSGSTPSGGNKNYKEEGISLIRSMNVYDGYFEFKDLAYIDEKQAEKLKNVEVLENDILFNITGASVTRTCIVPKYILPARVNQHVAIIRCTNKIDNIFLNSLFMNDAFKFKLLNIARSGGGTREAITKNQIEKIEIIVPPLELQKHFAKVVKITYEQISELEKLIANYKKLKKGLMQKLLTGKIRVKI